MNLYSSIPAAADGKVLNSWKEIANYVGRGVRTVQRWEKLGLPVRRPRAHSRSAVIAVAAEIDAWLRAAPTNNPIQYHHDRIVSAHTEASVRLQRQMELSRRLQYQCQELRVAHTDARLRVQAQIKTLLDS